MYNSLHHTIGDQHESRQPQNLECVQFPGQAFPNFPSQDSERYTCYKSQEFEKWIGMRHMAVGKLQRVPLRDAFRHEAHNFTVWLETNIDALSESLGFNLDVVEREKTVGSFNVDLLCKDQQDNFIIVENQLERSDHDHLGKLLTYLVNLEAKIAVWVTVDVRAEHQRVLNRR